MRAKVTLTGADEYIDIHKIRYTVATACRFIEKGSFIPESPTIRTPSKSIRETAFSREIGSFLFCCSTRLFTFEKTAKLTHDKITSANRSETPTT